MKSSWMRLIVVASVLVVLVFGAWTLGTAKPIPKDTWKCPQPACTTPCDPSYFFGTCQEGRQAPRRLACLSFHRDKKCFDWTD